MIKTFTSTSNKDAIRQLDLSRISEEFDHHGKKLRYFGLPSEGLYDIIQWKDFIEHFTAVERGQRSNPSAKQHLLVSKAMELGLHTRLTLLRGEVNQTITRGYDDIGQQVPYPFELVNLDYGGSVLYPDRLRTEALETFVSHQIPNDFLLLVTTNVREFDQEELLDTEERIISEIVSYRKDLRSNVENYFQWINSNNPILRQVVYLQFFIKYLAEQKRYKINCFPVVKYEGSKHTPLLHYTFRFRSQKGASTRVISDQNLVDILNQKSQELVDGMLREMPHPLLTNDEREGNHDET